MLYGERQIIMRAQKYKKRKDANNEVEYEEPSVTHEVPIYLTYSNVVGIFSTDLT